MTQNQANKAAVQAFWAAMDAAAPDEMGPVLARYLPDEFVFKGPEPIGTLTGPDELAAALWQPLKSAIPNMRRQTHLFCGGQSIDHVGEAAKDAFWVCGTGYLTGVQTGSFLGTPGVNQQVRIRWGEFIRFDGDTMVEAQVILDFVDWFDQIGLPALPKPRGALHVYPAPTAYDGILTAQQDTEETAETLRIGHDFIYGGLNAFDENDLSSMGMAKYFHPNVKWYGPGGIGACLSLTEFETLHQQPWLVAFPDRKVLGLESLFAEGRILAGSGVAGVRATHTGPYLGEAPTQAVLDVSGLDFWVRSGDVFTENWVFVDMVHLFQQMGRDLFARMAQQRDAKGLRA